MALNIIMGSNGMDDDTMISRWKAAHFEGNSDKALWLLQCRASVGFHRRRLYFFISTARFRPQ